MTPDENFAALNLELPPAPTPLGVYKPFLIDGNHCYVSGHGPEDINTYEPLYRGRVGTDLTLEDGYNAAAECAKTLLRAVQQRYGSLYKQLGPE